MRSRLSPSAVIARSNRGSAVVLGIALKDSVTLAL